MTFDEDQQNEAGGMSPVVDSAVESRLSPRALTKPNTNRSDFHTAQNLYFIDGN